ncbi:DUF2635 domain-containing protein [Vampirovibrio chlorellavorus]|uniref:DUF2635 domain-containing protein n=1 Tax=Vampirovibrio chlorellavorus TaxID=758823 RepID=UPI0026F0261C|nr:DUF2635 domain-containing protein [Vampirovibrio chlorellavorus]
MNKENLQNKVFVVPAHKDLIVRHPFTKRPIPADGLFVEDSPYIRRRLKDGDLLLANPKRRKKEEADE